MKCNINRVINPMPFPVKQAVKTHLAAWMDENRYTAPAFAQAIAKRLNVEYFSASTVRQWKKGISCPRRNSGSMQAIADITGGAVTYDMMDGDRA